MVSKVEVWSEHHPHCLLRNVSLHCWNLHCFLLTWCKALSQSTKERNAKAKPTSFSGHLLLHCSPRSWSCAAEGWMDGPMPNHPGLQMPFKNQFRHKHSACSFCMLRGMSSAGTCKMSQGQSQPCFSFAAISSFICASCQTSLTLNPQAWASVLSHSLIIHGIPSHTQTLPWWWANHWHPGQPFTALQRLPAPMLRAACSSSAAQMCWAKKNPGVRSLC